MHVRHVKVSECNTKKNIVSVLLSANSVLRRILLLFRSGLQQKEV
jgi:hypothetical protein